MKEEKKKKVKYDAGSYGRWGSDEATHTFEDVDMLTRAFMLLDMTCAHQHTDLRGLGGRRAHPVFNFA